MKDVIVVFGGMFMILSPYLGVVIIGSFIYPIYKKYPIKKSLYFKYKTENLKDEIENGLLAIYFSIDIVSLIVFSICCCIFTGLSDITAFIIFDTWLIIFTIGFCIFAVYYTEQIYGQAFYEHQAIKF